MKKFTFSSPKKLVSLGHDTTTYEIIGYYESFKAGKFAGFKCSVDEFMKYCDDETQLYINEMPIEYAENIIRAIRLSRIRNWYKNRFLGYVNQIAKN